MQISLQQFLDKYSRFNVKFCGYRKFEFQYNTGGTTTEDPAITIYINCGGDSASAYEHELAADAEFPISSFDDIFSAVVYKNGSSSFDDMISARIYKNGKEVPLVLLEFVRT